MKIAQGMQNEVKNHIFSGFYYQRVTGLRGRLYEFSSPSNPLSNFSVPYDAYLKNPDISGDRVIGAGRRATRDCPPRGDRSGSLYFYNNVDLIGACHGYGHNENTFYSGFNFYNAFYPMGNFSPPYGENFSIFLANLGGYENLNNGSCNPLTVTEYNEQFGIVSKTASDVELTSSTQTANIYAPIFSPKEACPPEVAIGTYYDEVQFANIAGTTMALGGNNYHNGNPIPTALDGFDIKVNGRYATISRDEGGKTVYSIVYTGGRAQPSYNEDSQVNKLNNRLCLANLMETKVSIGKGTNGIQLIEAPDALRGAVGDQVSFVGADDFHYWHFTFRENAATLPFANNFSMRESNKTVRVRAIGEGTMLFLPILSSEDSYWQNRQCPATVDFLPWTYGASIYACPSEHFDVPYYAATKKFGFYGTRFLNTCKSLNLSYSMSGVDNASEISTGNANVDLPEGSLEPEEELDADGNWSFAHYNNLLKVANAEERYANVYALNKGFFLWANSGWIVSGSDFTTLSVMNSGVAPLFNYLCGKFDRSFRSGLHSFTGSEPTLTLVANSYLISESGIQSDILLSDDEYIKFKRSLEGVLRQGEHDYWNNIENKFAYYVVSGAPDPITYALQERLEVNQNFYQSILSGREKRIMTRYFENMLRGNPVDLYPLNSIPFSFDASRDYIESTGWGRRETSFGTSSTLPEINRRYFEGAYSQSSAFSGLQDALNRLSEEQTTYYYPGFFNSIKCNKALPSPSYDKAFSGTIVDSSGRLFSHEGWMGLGYNEVGKLDANFSCFTPIFIQNPLPKVFCKVGQRPTLRALAVDYHTIPEDKLSRRYPEITFWASRLKLLDCNGRNLYPLRYKWYRIPKGNYSEALVFNNFLTSGEASHPTGNWSCLEGDGPECTVIHPNESFPVYTGVMKNPDSYTFIKGATKDIDDQYYYFCTVSGRFGVRMSNPTELQIEDWLRFDVSVKNGTNTVGELKVDFEVNDYEGNNHTITFQSSEDVVQYNGFQQDIDAVPESVIEQKIPPPNAGWGDVTAYRFIGPVGYIGATRSYAPSALKDTRGLREVWGHILEYGQLVPLERRISQTEGDLLYGYKHLPTCEDYQMPNGKKGVKATTYYQGYKVGHWTLTQKAVASLDNKAGIQWDKLFNHGELYPPAQTPYEIVFPNFAIGHWQWGNNLGAIKRFGKFSTKKDIKFVGGYGVGTSQNIEQVKEKLIGPTDLAGDNCGYTKYGLGRNMLYYLEAYERFYIICDPIKKKNVSNRSFICPGLRQTNSAIQYFWLGNPSNTYVKRRAMYGPYAYQWQVKRHNRDRNGNGMSEGFHSMGYANQYTMMYDAPAVYGLYYKKDTSNSYLKQIQQLEDARSAINGLTVLGVRNTWFGERRNEGTSRSYGNTSYSCDPTSSNYRENICNYVSAAQSIASNINWSDHVCPQDAVAEGSCFDPCLSMRYGQGFFPGGKTLDLFSNRASSDTNSQNPKTTKIVPLARINPIAGGFIAGDDHAQGRQDLVFRNPLSTPHARVIQGLKEIDGETETPTNIGGISPCQDGGSDHCNYLTPTLHLGVSSYLYGQTNFFNQLRIFASNIYNNEMNIRGEVS
jgi:hypothetical protein